MLRRLSELNRLRYDEEGAQGLHEKKKITKRAISKKAVPKAVVQQQGIDFGGPDIGSGE